MSDNPVSSYLQLGDPVDAYVPNENPAQLIDLDEIYRDTDQDGKSAMVAGAESVSLGKLSRELALKFNVPNAHQLDPYNSPRNAVVGTEGFFSTMVEGFKAFVEGIIKYVRMVFNWVANNVKALLGFRKSERIEKAITESLPGLQQEFKDTLTSLGFPGQQYNLEKFIGDLPHAMDRVGQLHLMRSKFDTDKDAIEGLTKSLPLFQECIALLNKASDRAVRASEQYRRVIKDVYSQIRVRKDKQDHVTLTLEGRAENSPELYKLMTANREVFKSLDTQEISGKVVSLLEGLYKVKFTNEALTDGFNLARKELDNAVAQEAVKLTQVNLPLIMAEIQELNTRYVEISDHSVDMSGINLRKLGEVVDKTDADKVQTIADYLGVVNPVKEYQELALALRNYSNFCQMVSRQLLIVGSQCTNLSRWYARAHLWFIHGILGDMNKLREVMLEARQDGHKPQADANGNPTFRLEFIPEADAKTFMENFTATNQKILDEDIAELKTKYNNLVKQVGIGSTL